MKKLLSVLLAIVLLIWAVPTSVLDPAHVMQTFNDFYNTIPQEVLDRETAKWNTKETPIPGYDLSQIQDYLNSVIPRLDAKYAAWL